MLPRNALLGAVVVVVVAFYCKLWNVQLLQPQNKLLEQLQQNRQASEPVVIILGRGFFVIAAAAWAVLSLQSVIVGIQRARYKPRVRQPLQPLSEEQARHLLQQQTEQQDTAAPPPTQPVCQSATATTATAAAQQQPEPQQQQQQQVGDWRDERRLKALEAAQRILDEQASAAKAQQEREEAERRARKAEAVAAAAAAKQVQQEAEAEARRRAEAELAERKAQWDQAVSQQRRAVAPRTPEPAETDPQSSSIAGTPQNPAGSSTPAAAAAGSVAGATAAAAAAAAAAAPSESPADVMQQQDLEYDQSLEVDRAKAATSAAQQRALQQEQQRQQLLESLRQSLQQKQPAEPSDDCGLPVLTLRVRLPGGATASRHFSRNQGFAEVLDWVYSLSDMPLWVPGSWGLISSFPRKQLLPPSDSIWAPGVWQQQQQQVAAAAAAEDGGDGATADRAWQLQVYRLACGPLWVCVHDGSSLAEVKQQVAAQTGLPAASQRLVFKGQVLTQPDATLAEFGIKAGHTVLLAVSGKATSHSDDNLYGDDAAADATPAAGAAAGAAISDPGNSSNSSSGSGGAAAGGDRDRQASERAQQLAKAAEQAYLGSGDVVVVGTVAELQQRVAAGAALLALYVQANV